MAMQFLWRNEIGLKNPGMGITVVPFCAERFLEIPERRNASKKRILFIRNVQPGSKAKLQK